MFAQRSSLVSSLPLVALLVLGACSGDDDSGGKPKFTPTAPPSGTAAPTMTEGPPPTETATPVGTATGMPPSATPTASPTEAATATPTNPVLDRTPDQVVQLPGLPSGAVAYTAFDSLGIPHIYADDLPTALYVQGYETAKVRFWQMDVFRRVAEGRLSELFGTITLSMDAQMRTVFTTRDGRRLEQELWERLQEEGGELLASAQAYSDGINTWLDDLRNGRNGAVMPPEYSLLSFTPDDLADWHPRDSLAIGRLQAYFLSETLEEELAAAERMAALRDDLRLDVFRSAPATDATVLPVGGGAKSIRSRAAAQPAAPLPSQELLGKLLRMFEQNEQFNPLGRRDRGTGSNNWIVSPALSANGHAMLANDPHLQLFNPAIWHMVQLNGGGMHVTGENFPGLPGIILGHNDFGAWGGTVAVFDVTDIYMEQVTTPPDYPKSPRTVLFNGKQVDVLRVEEKIGMPSGSAATIVIEVVPHHGPMVPDPDLNDGVDGLAATNMSVRWTGHEITLDSRFLNDLNRARNVEEFKQAVRSFAVGAQNWVWADVNGDIAYFPYTLVPQRPAGTVPYLPMDGTGSAEWLKDGQGNTLWLPEEKFPQATNPPEGYLATSNNDQFGNTLDNDPLNDDVYLTFSDDIGFRQQRILDMLSNRAGLRPPGAKISLEEMSAYQYDTTSLEASRLLPFLFDAADRRSDLVTPEMSDALDRLREWGVEKEGSPAWTMASGVDPAEGRTDVPPRSQPVSDEEKADAIAASIYAAWSTRLSRNVFLDDFRGSVIGAPGGQDATKALLHILEDIDSTDPNFIVHTKGENGESTLWDDKNTPEVETRDEILVGSLNDALTFLTGLLGSDNPEDWLWGKFHKVRYQHFFAQAGIDAFDIGGFPAPGGRFTVNPADFSLNANGASNFVFSDGPSKRFVAVLDPAGIHSVSALPGGNNGNPCIAGDIDGMPCGLTTASYNHINPDTHYGDLIPGWINGDVFDYRVSPDAVANDTQRLIEYEGSQP